MGKWDKLQDRLRGIYQTLLSEWVSGVSEAPRREPSQCAGLHPGRQHGWLQGRLKGCGSCRILSALNV